MNETFRLFCVVFHLAAAVALVLMGEAFAAMQAGWLPVLCLVAVAFPFAGIVHALSPDEA